MVTPEGFRVYSLDRSSAIGLEYGRRLELLKAEMPSWAAVVPTFPHINQKAAEYNLQVFNSEVLPEGLSVVCLIDFPVLAQPRKHDYSHLYTGDPEEDRKKTSHAFHYVDGVNYKGHKAWIHGLLEYTSTHKHSKHELQLLLYGEIDVGGKMFRAGDLHVVEPGMNHSATAHKKGAIMLCVLMDGATEEEEKVHLFK